ncbi:hypothetical protein [Methylobacterium dankookense]|uniref:Phage tail lysozyme domain-containing protein n=1 Tax=Methylobacterium dankookense TaxID=560405 RepID=A0A564G6Z0_9HYPH|nr:hypothetical protein [Methylobacterium dankookense]GJD59715.1 hypothetical protein IFDJLNFL_5646 [Methylobacterium dankookense]VUF16107.1 hypothetical protein MTDSW087_05858 [Methylobacterium dankookense]
MAEDRFRLTAEIGDQFSGPLKRMRTMLGEIRPTPEMRAVREELNGLAGAVQRLHGMGRGMSGRDMLGGIGLDLSVAAGIGAVVASMRALSKEALEMRHISRETGLTAQNLRALQKTGERFQIAPDTVIAGTQSFAEKLSLLRRGLGEFSGELRQKAPGIFGQLQGSKDTMDALDKYLSFLSKIKDPQTLKQYTDLMGLGGFNRLFTDGPEALGKALREEMKKAASEPDFSKQAQEAAEHWRDLKDTLEQIQRMAAPEIFKYMADFAKSTRTDIENIVALEEKLKSFADGVKSYIDNFGTAAPPEEAGKPSRRGPGAPAETEAERRIRALQGRKGSLDQQLQLMERNPGSPDYALKHSRLVEELKRVGDELEKLRNQGATAQPSSFGGGSGWGGMIHRAGWGGGFGPGSFGPGSAAAEAFNNSPQGRITRDLKGLPQPGASESTGAGAKNPAASKALADAIAGTESGKGGYNTVLGNGRYGRPDKPISTMTLDEAYAFGRTVRARHGSSSALGRYQIVGSTMKLAQRALGLSGDTLFNDETQDRMMRWIARNQGLGAWEGLKGNPGAMLRAREAMAAGGALDAPLVSPDAIEAVRRAQGKSEWERGTGLSRIRDDQVVKGGSMLAPGDMGMLQRRRLAEGGGGSPLDGSVNMAVTFRNAPPGMGISTKSSGVVKEVAVDRGTSLYGTAAQ